MSALGRASSGYLGPRSQHTTARLADGQTPPAVGDVLLVDEGAVRVRRVYARTVWFEAVNVRRALLGAARWELVASPSGRTPRLLRRMT